jgi:alpha-beta hydrolase superfamily lysophospholipase
VWVHTFEDYVDDFVYFVTTLSQEAPNLANYVLAHSMGGFIAAIAMARLPSLISRAVLCAPMIRMKCGMKATDFQMPLPQPATYWIVAVAKYFGLGTRHALGYFTEKATDKININVYTSSQSQLDQWIALRMRYPQLIATCVTNDWVYHSLRANQRFADRYEFVKTNTLILR